MNNVVAKNENTISFDKGFRKLKNNQKDFYNILAYKIKANENISYAEMEKFYLEKVIVNKDKMYWNYYANVQRDNDGKFISFKGGYSPLQPWQIEQRVKDWTMRTIGILVIRGYLKVLPIIDFSIYKNNVSV